MQNIYSSQSRHSLLLTAAFHIDPALAQEAEAAAEAAPPAIDTGDTAWMLTSTAIVLMMTIPGLALFYGGMVRKKNVLVGRDAVLRDRLCHHHRLVAGRLFACLHRRRSAQRLYRRTVEGDAGKGVTKDAITLTIPETVFFTFQLTFAIITPALIVGAFVDRMKFSAMLLFMVLWSLIVYVPITHWVWGGGFLAGAGVLDFAGGTVVHINAGVAGLVCAIFLGKRYGYGTENMAPHNLVYSVIGASLLWVGWFGFNAGSAVAANAVAPAWPWPSRRSPRRLRRWPGCSSSGSSTRSRASSASSPARWRVSSPSRRHRASSARWAHCGSVSLPVSICFFASTTIKKALGYDDSLDVFGIHGVGGIVGAILTGVFAVEAIGGKPGMLEGNPGQVLTQIWGITATIVWCAVATFVILIIVNILLGVRVSQAVEVEGLDINLHGEVVP